MFRCNNIVRERRLDCERARRDRSASISRLADKGALRDSRGRISAFAASRRPDGALWCNTSKENIAIYIKSVYAFAEEKIQMCVSVCACAVGVRKTRKGSRVSTLNIYILCVYRVIKFSCYKDIGNDIEKIYVILRLCNTRF